MNNTKPALIWRIIRDLLLMNNRWIATKLLEYAMRQPYTHLPGYMKRWWLIRHPDQKDQSEYGTFKNGLRHLWPVYARFHHILRADDGRDHHDHPFWFVSIILRGYYREERLREDGTVINRFVGAGYINIVKKGEFHRITEVSNDGVVTLVFHGLKRGSWGFKVNGSFIPWRKYHNVDLMPVEVRNQVKPIDIYQENH